MESEGAWAVGEWLIRGRGRSMAVVDERGWDETAVVVWTKFVTELVTIWLERTDELTLITVVSEESGRLGWESVAEEYTHSEEGEGWIGYVGKLLVLGAFVGPGIALWSGINKNRDVSTGSLARPFARGKVNY